ncbi:uncharacterized protein PFL1_00422 [Pseudozyma flocculosa PF-1]|uniref:Uridine kinase n=1 Tax=Pseudozyma flocculosa TaxID=84751 RepID=A0A5C3ETI5_9BASI|nr:uncharacterized protein PFL1_00422 [Pseudozyma flocculosa PF-1]EPQ32225.1 hypothetical protein PFL1_00422 [Pseudozyma flocculosa PF-1]SPO34827.1 related to URK1 - uridine kinase [Pseudozyma flocculosa]
MQAAHQIVQPSTPGTPLLRTVESAEGLGTPSSPSLQPIAKPSAGGPSTRSKTIVLAEAGRPPWYNAAGQTVPPYIVGIAGGSASGKTSVARAILEKLPNVPHIVIISQDSFYKPLTKTESERAFRSEYDFDHPSAFDTELFKATIDNLSRGMAVEVPVYSFVKHNRLPDSNYLYGPAVLIVEGIFVLHDPELRDLLSLKIFVDLDSDLMLARRILRDTVERGRDLSGIISQYTRYVKPNYERYVSPTSKHADIIVPGANNEVAVDIISQHMEKQLRSRAMRLRTELSKTPATPHVESASPFDTMTPLAKTPSLGLANTPLPNTVILLPQTPQLQSLLTILHDRSTPTSDFTFACKRVGTLVVERAAALLPYRQQTVQLHTGGSYTGMELDVSSICSVSILRSGSVLEPSLRRAFPAMSLGSLLIQSNEEDGEPYLYDVSLPSFVRRRSSAEKSWVLLLDAQIGTGAAAFMAIRVLLDHSVPEDQIIFLTLLASAKGGVHALHRAFPKVRIVVAGIDPGLEKLRIPLADRRASVSADHAQSTSAHQTVQVSRSAPHHAAPARPDEPAKGDHPTNVDGQGRGRAKPRQDSLGVTSPPAKNSRVVFAITPGCGSIGDRFWGTGAK